MINHPSEAEENSLQQHFFKLPIHTEGNLLTNQILSLNQKQIAQQIWTSRLEIVSQNHMQIDHHNQDITFD